MRHIDVTAQENNGNQISKLANIIIVYIRHLSQCCQQHF